MDQQENIVVSTRVRLARNLSGLNFPPKMKEDDFANLSQRILSRVNGSDDFTAYKMKDLDLLKRQAFVERHQASLELANRPEGTLLVDKNQRIVIMLGEEDHLRIQCLLPGLQLKQADDLTRAIDSLIAPEGYAFSDKLGYLTSCPTNVGTGMRASTMLHLAGLTTTGEIRTIAESVSQYGYIIRGYYGEGSNALGDMYQLSNQVTLGVSEDEILMSLSQLLRSIIEKEQALRQKLIQSSGFVDKLFRSFGILKYAKRMNHAEMMTRISDLKVALAENLIQGISIEEIDQLLTNLQPAILAEQLGEETKAEDRDEARAQALQKALVHCEIV